ncbi:Com family DNA-binding transcriptional regulator [Desulfovibrio psychrotolerans]|uniref:Com family DNA-binding transcriptional regulator n=1 Tax=Desulfovibrio psychrotolerans TaxID=415242 RepID=UPI00157B021E|nr:Com family DNA-binding transcriptional regulator [Desulfovibrio psychrotolerans]
MQEIRCGQCNRLLAKGEVVELEIKCKRCHTMNYMRIMSPCREARAARSEMLSDRDRTCETAQRRGAEPHDGHAG